MIILISKIIISRPNNGSDLLRKFENVTGSVFYSRCNCISENSTRRTSDNMSNVLSTVFFIWTVSSAHIKA